MENESQIKIKDRMKLSMNENEMAIFSITFTITPDQSSIEYIKFSKRKGIYWI